MSANFGDNINLSVSHSRSAADASEARNLDALLMPLVADTAHDLRNLASNFKTRLYLTRVLPQKSAEHLTELEHLVDHLDALAQKLLTVSRPELNGLTPALKPLNLNEVAARVIKAYEPVATFKGLTLTFEAAPALSPILADDLDLVRVVVNLLANALNYTPAAGTISLTTAQGSDAVSLTVRDSGIGISSEALPHIFERFYRSEEAQRTATGTGIGLAIVQGIVEKYRGHIEVESTTGEGSVFKVFLPAYKEKPVSLQAH